MNLAPGVDTTLLSKHLTVVWSAVDDGAIVVNFITPHSATNASFFCFVGFFGGHNAEECGSFVAWHLGHCNETHGFCASQHVGQHAFGESSQFIHHALDPLFPIRSESELSVLEDVAGGRINHGICRPEHTGDWCTRIKGCCMVL